MQQEYLPSFARRIGKSLSKQKKFLLDQKLETYSPTNIDFSTHKKLFLEIGSGMGDFISYVSRENSRNIYIACEPFINGLVSMYEKAGEVDNLFAWPDDARVLLSKIIPDNRIERVYILFPDPWPKASQNKKRLINQFLINLITPKIKDHGSIFVATDDPDYAKSILIEFIRSEKYSVDITRDFHQPFSEWTNTKYYNKSKNRPYFFEFFKL